MMGGRGTGKTDGGAVWFDEHMMGPPFDTRMPGGHKAAIIAPTLGDAFQSCVEGVSGLKVHNPLVYSVTRKGGTYVIWPNGAQAKLFGAYAAGRRAPSSRPGGPATTSKPQTCYGCAHQPD
jgi:phage terminase large subunit-like protein